MTTKRNAILYGVVRDPGASEADIRGMVSETGLSEDTRKVLEDMESAGEVAVSKGIIGHSRFGIPQKGLMYYPTQIGTSRLLLDYVLAHPGCDEDDVNGYLAPDGGIPNWVETDIQALVDDELMEIVWTGRSIGKTNAIRLVRSFKPTTKAYGTSVSVERGSSP